MPLHPTLQSMLDKVAGLPPIHTFTVDQVRAGDLARYALAPRPEVSQVEDRKIAGPRGDIAIRIYRPDIEEGRPVIVFFHGSGFCICSIDTHDGMCRQICRRTGAIVVSVDYALAPEAKFPAAPDDCLAATHWVAENAAAFGGDPTRLALVGDSAGGTLAAVTTLRIRDEGRGPVVAAQVMMYPVTDHPSAGMPSYAERATGCGLTADGMRWFWSHYLARETDGTHPYAAPNRADTLADLPPAYVITAEYDPLRDEGEAYARRLEEAEVDTTHVRYGDMNHGFMTWVGVVDRAEEAMDAACAWLRAKLRA